MKTNSGVFILLHVVTVLRLVNEGHHPDFVVKQCYENLTKRLLSAKKMKWNSKMLKMK